MLVSFLSALIPWWIALDGGYTRPGGRDLNVGADFGDHAHHATHIIWLRCQRAWELTGEGRSLSSAARGAGFPTPRTSLELHADCSALRPSLSSGKGPNDLDTPRGRRWASGYHLAGS